MIGVDYLAERSRRLRRGYPIAGAVGPNGSGKSALMVWDTLPSLEAGRPCLSTIRLLDYQNPRPCDDPTCTSPDHSTHMAAHPLYIPWTDWDQLVEAEHCDILADEITGVVSSRDSSSLPSPIINKLMQLRRADCYLRWTAPSFARAAVALREVSQIVTVCHGYLPVMDRESDRIWRQRRLFAWATYDALDLSEFETARREKLRKLAFGMFWGPGSVVFDAYDTLDDVSAINTVGDSGRCLKCGKRRRQEMCTGHDGEGSRQARGPRRGAPGAELTNVGSGSALDAEEARC